jgi:DNA polymerase-1
MLLSYLVNPTHGSHTLPDIAARTTSRALTHQPTKDNPADRKRLPEAAAAVVRLASALGKQIAEAGSFEHHILKDDPSLGGAMTKEMLFATPVTANAAGTSPLLDVYNTIDKPLVPVLLRMEQVGVRIDSTVLGEMSSRLAVEIDNLAERIYAQSGAAMGADSGHRFNINSPKQLGDVLFNKMLLPKPMKYGKGKVVSTAQDVLEELAEQHQVPALVLEYRQLAKLDLPRLASSTYRRPRSCPYDLQPGRHCDRASLFNQSQSAEHSYPHRAWTRDPRCFHPGSRQCAHVGRLFADRASPDGSLLAGPSAA